jgi:CRISPR-associated protein Cas1
MKKSYYLFNPGRLSRRDNTLKFTPVDQDGNEGQPRYLPVENVDNLYAFGSIDANSAMYNFLGKNHIAVHFFDYYEHYTGSFMPKEYLLAGQVQIKQTEFYLLPEKRLPLAQKILEGGTHNMLKILRYYENRERDIYPQIQKAEHLAPKIFEAKDIPTLMGIEGNIRQAYYEAFDEIITDFNMEGRSRQPPKNEVNALISLCNMCCYTACLDQIYHTQLNPTISYLHQPGVRRYSLALDLAEIFKPILADRLIFNLLNKKIIKKTDFEHKLNGILLKPKAQRKVLEAWDARLNETIKHRSLGKNISYKRIIRLECSKLIKHMQGITEYEPFKMWW